MMSFSLLHQILLFVEPSADRSGGSKEFLILFGPLFNLSRKHSVIGIDQHKPAKQVEKTAVAKCAEKH